MNDRSFDDSFTASLRTLGDDEALRDFLQNAATIHRVTLAIDEPNGQSFAIVGESSWRLPPTHTCWLAEAIVYDGVNIGLLRLGHDPLRPEHEVEPVLAHVRIVLDLLLHHGHRSAVSAALQEATMRGRIVTPGAMRVRNRIWAAVRNSLIGKPIFTTAADYEL